MKFISKLIRKCAASICSQETIDAVIYDFHRKRLRLIGRFRHRRKPPSSRLHFGCGGIHLDGWFNADLKGSDFDIDLSSGRLPWPDDVFECAVGNHVIEHLDLSSEALPLLQELHRVIKPGGILCLSCPDMKKLCEAYIQDGMEDLVKDRIQRRGNSGIGDLPDRYFLNDMFYQRGRNRSPHKNLFDYELLHWALERAGFTRIEKGSSRALTEMYPEIPCRRDDKQAIYVSARNR